MATWAYLANFWAAWRSFSRDLMVQCRTALTSVSRSTSSRYMCIFFSVMSRHFLSLSTSFSSALSRTSSDSWSGDAGLGVRKRSTTRPDAKLRKASTTSSNLNDVMSSSLMDRRMSPGLITPHASPGASRPDGSL
ncbi:hypothetical protein H257_17183 [Aphanomyces astaci]|uniref:Uncharacterized protein n=1 Tax=Aphanomyces astaci TaxID=112090 RepID=W4FG39_APHAT|nr:hypothetical protein H257_17183 [Aphanomyces astaci]ETV66405.1 hypothetical protein H257_17183 [Aphanomyces astaci]|eukprot:XP_009844180.1 hypothetical protein H257_17183 [Aphanomyces astaci]